MKRVLAVVLFGVVAMLAPSTHASKDDENARGGDDNDSKDRTNANSEYNGSKCSSQVAANPSYLKCSAVAPFSLGATGVALPTAFCQSTDCYAFWSGLASENIAKCMSGYKVGSIAVSNASGMTDCFTDGGGLQPATAATIAPPTKAAATPTSNLSKTTDEITREEPKATTTSMPQGAPGIVGASGVAVDTPTVAKAAAASVMATTGPSTATPSTPARPMASKGQPEVNEEGDIVVSGSGSGQTATKIATKKRTNPAGGVVEEGTLEDHQAESQANSTTKGSRMSKPTGVGSQSGSSALDQDRDDGGSSPTSVWVASGGTSGGVLLVIFIFVFVRKRKPIFAQAKNLGGTRDSGDYLATLDSSPSQAAVFGASAVSNSSLPSSRFAFWDDDIVNAVRIPFEKLAIGERISRGAYGEVHRGMYRGQPIAIKSLLPERRKDMRQIEKFITEVKLMAVLEHEHIVRFIGVAWDSLNELCVVSAFMAGGDLRSLLARYEANERVHPRGFDDDKTKIAMHVAHALTFMHSMQPPVLHRDLKSRNVLLDMQLNAHLTDFGISRECGDGTMTTGVGSSLWMAPEVMRGGRYDEKADVFSFGVVLSELDVQTLPYAHALEPGTGRKLPDTVVVQMMITGRICVQFTLEAESPLAQLGRQCVALDPDDRPSAAEVQHRLHQLWMNPSDSL